MEECKKWQEIGLKHKTINKKFSYPSYILVVVGWILTFFQGLAPIMLNIGFGVEMIGVIGVIYGGYHFNRCHKYVKLIQEKAKEETRKGYWDKSMQMISLTLNMIPV